MAFDLRDGDTVEADEDGLRYLFAWGGGGDRASRPDRMLLCGMIIQAAKDVSEHRAGRWVEGLDVHGSAEYWFLHPEEGVIPLSWCFSVLFPQLQDSMTAMEFGQAILKNADRVGLMDIPTVTEAQEPIKGLQGFSDRLFSVLDGTALLSSSS